MIPTPARSEPATGISKISESEVRDRTFALPEELKRQANEVTFPVEVSVSNQGRRAGSILVQIHARQNNCEVPRPARWLIAFIRVPLKAGEARTVLIDCPVSKLRDWHPDKRQWCLDKARYGIQAIQHTGENPEFKELRVC